MEEFQRKLTGVLAELEKSENAQTGQVSKSENVGKNDRNLDDVADGSQYDLSFLDTESYRPAKVVEMQTFHHTVDPEALEIRHLSLSHNGRKKVLSSGYSLSNVSGGQQVHANRELALSPNAVQKNALSGEPLEKVKEIIDRYQKIDSKITAAKSDVLYMNCDLGLNEGSETEFVHLAIIHARPSARLRRKFTF